MKTFYEFMESVGTDLANEIGPMGLTKEKNGSFGTDVCLR